MSNKTVHLYFKILGIEIKGHKCNEDLKLCRFCRFYCRLEKSSKSYSM